MVTEEGYLNLCCGYTLYKFSLIINYNSLIVNSHVSEAALKLTPLLTYTITKASHLGLLFTHVHEHISVLENSNADLHSVFCRKHNSPVDDAHPAPPQTPFQTIHNMFVNPFSQCASCACQIADIVIRWEWQVLWSFHSFYVLVHMGFILLVFTDKSTDILPILFTSFTGLSRTWQSHILSL